MSGRGQDRHVGASELAAAGGGGMVTPRSRDPTAGPDDEMPPELRELWSDFAIEAELGRGGTAVVYRARERALDRLVAIKVIRAPYVGDDELVARLEREARLVARLDHPNIVALLGVRRLQHQSLALVMRYVQGHTLREELERRGALPLARADAVLRDVGHALTAAHARGVVHRDVKPENIHIEHGAQRALLADFGAATPLRGDLRLTVAGMAIGTPGYMAPELIDGIDATPSSDVYSLGLVAWEMLAGRPPWEGDSLFAVLSFRKQRSLPPLAALRDDVPPSISDAVAGALHSDPAERWPDVHRFLEELSRPAPRRWRRGAGGVRRSGLPGAEGTAATTAEFTPVRGGGLGVPVGDQPTVRFERPVTRATTGGAGPEWGGAETRAATPPPPSAEAPPRVHPSAAAFAADDEPELELDYEEPAPFPRRRALLGAVASLLLVAAVAGMVRLRHTADEPASTVAEAAGDVPQSFTLPLSADSQQRAPPGELPGPPASLASGPAAATEATQPLTGLPDLDPAGRPPPAASGPPGAEPPSPAALDSRQPAMAATRRQAQAARSLSPDADPAPSAPATTAPRPAAPTPTPTPTPRPAVGSGEPARPSASRAPAATVAEPATEPVAESPSSHPPAAGVGGRAGGSPAAGRGTIASVALGGMHSCARLSDGGLRCWGSDDRSQLGTATIALRATSVAAGVMHSCARSSDGRTFCWGENGRGQLGDGTRTTRGDPRPVAGSGDQVALALGEWHSCALARGGRASCWGANDAGQLGTGDRRDRSVPADVATELRFATISAGWRHSCAATAEGRAYCWGDNSAGQLGDGTFTPRESPTAVNSSLRFLALAAGRAHSCGLATTGEVYCWGRNDSGQLGTGSRRGASTPRLVAAPARARSVVAGSMYSCLLTAAGAAYCWGQNRYGQLGDGTTIDRDTPVRVAGAPALAELEASGAHSCGRSTAGELLCWGFNLYGQLGDGTRQDRSRPAPVTLPP